MIRKIISVSLDNIIPATMANTSSENQDHPGEALGEEGKSSNSHPGHSLDNDTQLCQEIGSRKRAEQITKTLFKISNAVSTSKDLNELYSSIHGILGQTIDLSNFFIAIYNKKAKKVSFPYFVDQFDSDIVYSDQFSLENSLTGEVIVSQKAVFHSKEDLLQRAENNRIIGTVPNAWLGVPLKIKGEVIGIMATQCYDEPHRFDQIDLDILNSVSDQVALAIERKRNEQAVLASEKRYRNIIESIEDGYYEIDLNGRLTLVNQALCKILGYAENELLGMKTSEYMSAESAEKIGESFASVLSSKKPGTPLELQFRMKKGDRRYGETVVSSFRNEDGSTTGFRGIIRDITERKKEEKARKTLEEQLQQSQRLESLGTLAGGIAHDFNNLLMGIQGRTELMLNGLTDQHPHYVHLSHIEKYLESATSLTQRLLGFARGGKYEVQPIDLNVLIEKSIQLFGRTKKEIILKITLKNGLPPIEADYSQIEQVLVNLLVNASQAMPGGGRIEIETNQVLLNEDTARYHDITPGNYVELTIKDSGKGMDKEIIGKIFDPFFTTKDIGHGTGLGLAMVYGIIRNHSGAISVASKLNCGTIFTIFLPASEKTIPANEKIQATVTKGSEVIVLVDDEPMILEVGQEILAALGYDVLTASSGQEAIEVFINNQSGIDLFIIDMIMPQMSGGELFDRLKSIHPEVKVLLASGYSIDGEAREILERGCKGFIQKPFTIAELSVKLRQILA